jgi:aryl-alcohol dehydrogenase-like predicted oxidoreductase
MRYLDIDAAKRISKIGLGTWQFGSEEWGYGESYAKRTAHAIVSRALELGVTLFDTAEIYGSGRSERILGRALGDDRESVFVATKIFPLFPAVRIVRNRAVASANRLGVSRLDLYQVHWSNPFIGDDTIMRGMRGMQECGRVDEVGVSGYSLERWHSAERALGSRVLTNQVAYSLVNRSPERDLLPFAESQGHVIIAFSPLAMGLLSGKYHRGSLPVNSARAKDPRFHPDNLERTNHLITTLREVADAHSAIPAQIALAWVIHRSAVAAIPGASSVEQLERNVAAAEIQLADDEYQALQAASSRFLPSATLDAPRHPDLHAVKHLAKAAGYMAKTVLYDFKSHTRRMTTPPFGSDRPPSSLTQQRTGPSRSAGG